jgi:hypothetical protein
MLSAPRFVTVLVLASVVGMGVSACGTNETAKPGASATATQKPGETSAPSAEPTTEPTPEPEPTSAPIAVDCNGLLSPDVMYAYNPNFSLETNFTPAADSEIEAIAELGGLACGWVNQTSGQVIQLGVASLDEKPLTELKNDFIMNSQPVPTFGDPRVVEGYFTMAGSTGQAEAFSGPFWVSANSELLSEPGDAEPIMTAALAALGQ